MNERVMDDSNLTEAVTRFEARAKEIDREIATLDRERLDVLHSLGRLRREWHIRCLQREEERVETVH